LQKRAGSQQTRFPIGDEKAEPVRMPLMIETNFSSKIQGRVDQRSVHEKPPPLDLLFLPSILPSA